MSQSFLPRKLPLLAALLALVVAAPARAEAPPPPKEESFFTTTNVQLLWGGGFSDAQLGYYTKTQSMFTLTLNNYTQFKYGDSFAFVDMYQGDFVDPFLAPHFNNYNQKGVLRYAQIVLPVESGLEFAGRWNANFKCGHAKLYFIS